ncbi:hypothetical protein [Pseudaquabacterium pictum]|uniref:Uncharacterized protein n=1 Tax=Pseudaquabacterium pictum TaxID=2315236 RepID=A0A480ATP7_9BURK|nr:hypothetical protein [Rubrivivax pictus]GCL64326.1 hypothetical protein AQPW35_34070 [Rubrivivax pictus]
MKTDRVGSGADLKALIGALCTAEVDVAHDFPQCTKLEKRGMLAMRLHQLYGWIALRFPGASSEAVGYRMIKHAWWIAGLVLQRDRKAEVKVAISAATWQAVLDGCEAPPELQSYAAQVGALKDEAAVEAFAAEVWRRLGLSEKSRLKP